MSNLHPQLVKDCIQLGTFELCHLLLMNDSQYPWFILVPDRDDISEIYQLSKTEQSQLLHESSQFSITIATVFHADKLNIAALGNVVPQLHVHHIVRYKTDPAWPAPVWGRYAAIAYTDEELRQVISRLKVNMPDFSFIV